MCTAICAALFHDLPRRSTIRTKPLVALSPVAGKLHLQANQRNHEESVPTANIWQSVETSSTVVVMHKYWALEWFLEIVSVPDRHLRSTKSKSSQHNDGLNSVKWQESLNYELLRGHHDCRRSKAQEEQFLQTLTDLFRDDPTWLIVYLTAIIGQPDTDELLLHRVMVDIEKIRYKSGQFMLRIEPCLGNNNYYHDKSGYKKELYKNVEVVESDQGVLSRVALCFYLHLSGNTKDLEQFRLFFPF